MSARFPCRTGSSGRLRDGANLAVSPPERSFDASAGRERPGAMASRNRRSGMLSGCMPPNWGWAGLHRMIFAGRVLVCATGAGGELEQQIRFLLGHVSVQTTERYLGCKQRFRGAVNDRIGIEPSPGSRPRGLAPLGCLAPFRQSG
jgi:hypothetical protein